MPEPPKLINNPVLQSKVEKNLGKPVIAMLELPMNAAEQKIVQALGLKEGDILNAITLGGVHTHTWCCCVSVPPDCDADIDG
jgi:hypothetical protein